VTIEAGYKTCEAPVKWSIPTPSIVTEQRIKLVIPNLTLDLGVRVKVSENTSSDNE